MSTSPAKMLWICVTLALGASLGCSADVTSAGNQGLDEVGDGSEPTLEDEVEDGSERTLEDDVADVMLERSQAALSEAPGGGGHKSDCIDAWLKCDAGCKKFNTNWDVATEIIWGSSPYTRCHDRCDIALHVCEGAADARGGIF
jgi:hypothetical protein